MRIILSAIVAIFPASFVKAQSFGGSTNTGKTLQETEVILKQARRSADDEVARQASDKSSENDRFERLASEAREKLSARPEDGRRLVEDADRRLEPALKSASPEARVLIAQSESAPLMRAPDPDAPAAPSLGAPKAPLGERSNKGQKGKGDVAPPQDIEIHCEGAVYIDNANMLTIFTDDVVMDHPQFHLTCDKLEAYFLKDDEVKKPEAKTATDPKLGPNRLADPDTAPVKPVEPADSKSSGDAKLKQAIATGRKVVIRKLDEKGELQIGVCRHATYIGSTGDVILRQRPQVQRGTNLIVARDDTTYMVLKQNGQFVAHGPTDTKIVQKPEEGVKPKGPAQAANGPKKEGNKQDGNKPAADQNQKVRKATKL